MDGIAQELHFPALQELLTVEAVLRRAGHDDAAAGGKERVRQPARRLHFQLRVGKEAHAALRNAGQRLHLCLHETVLRARRTPEAVGLQPVQLVQKLRVAVYRRLWPRAPQQRQKLQSPAVFRHRQQNRFPGRKPVREAGQKIEAQHRRGARVRAVGAVDHGKLRPDAADGIRWVEQGTFRIVAGEQQRLPFQSKFIPDAARAVAAPAPAQTKTLRRPERAERRCIRKGKRQLAERLVARSDRPGKALLQKPRQRARMVGVAVCQKDVLQRQDLLRRQLRIRLRAPGQLSAVDEKADALPLDEKAISPVFSNAAGDQNFHITLPSAFRRGD